MFDRSAGLPVAPLMLMTGCRMWEPRLRQLQSQLVGVSLKLVSSSVDRHLVFVVKDVVVSQSRHVQGELQDMGLQVLV